MLPSDLSLHSTFCVPSCLDVAVLSLDRRASPEARDSELFTLTLRAPGWKSWLPGQFVMIRPQSAPHPDVFWARPFSISQMDEEKLRIVFQVAGRGTRALLGLERGELVTVWGPLGNGFAVSRSGPTLLLAGGIGIAPFVGYIERHPAPETLRLEFGHKLHLDCYPFVECLSANCTLAKTEAGKILIEARNHHETCPEDLSRFVSTMADAIRDTAARNGLVLACGPMPFLKSVKKIASQFKAQCQISLETRMACGVGACLGCVVKNTAPKVEMATASIPEVFRYVQTCTTGPVFWADQIEFDE